MRKRRKRRKSVRWGPVLWLLFVINVASGLAFSSVTSADRVRVEGGADFDRARIGRIVSTMKDVPCLRVDGYRVESLALNSPEVKSACLKRNIFRRAVLQIEYRKPVARIFGKPGIALSAEGIVFPSSRSLKDLPLLKTPPGEPAPNIAFCATWTGETIAYVCERVKAIGQMKSGTVEVRPWGSVYLHNEFGTRVDLGPSERLPEKLDKLEEILRENPGILLQVKELNLVSPSHATKIRRGQGVKP